MTDFIYINPKFTELIRKYNFRDFNHILSLQATPVTLHTHREVRKLYLPDENINLFIRIEHKISIKDILSDLTSFHQPLSRAKKSFQAYYKLAESNIPSPEPICSIEKRTLGVPQQAIIIQREVKGINLYDQLKNLNKTQDRYKNISDRQLLLYQLGEFLAKLHQAKINWPDLLAKHIFVTFNKEEKLWQFALIDTERLSFSYKPSTWHIQLKKLLSSLRAFLTPTDIMRIATGYLNLKSLPHLVRKNIIQKLLPDVKDWIKSARMEMHFLKYFYPKSLPLPEEEVYQKKNSLVINTHYESLLSSLNITDKNSLLDFENGTELIKKSTKHRKRIRSNALWDGKHIWIYTKKTNLPSLTDQLTRILNGAPFRSSAWYEYHMIKTLNALRIPTPRIIAYTEKMFSFIELKSAIMTEGIIGQSLEIFIPKIFSRPPTPEELKIRRTWIRKLATLISHLHRNNFCHRDLYLSHIFISFPQSSLEPIFYLIDLARCFKLRFRKKRWLIKDLASLNFSAPHPLITYTDRLRFIKTYLNKEKLDSSDKKFIKRLLRKTKKIARHSKKHKAELTTTEKPIR